MRLVQTHRIRNEGISLSFVFEFQSFDRHLPYFNEITMLKRRVVLWDGDSSLFILVLSNDRDDLFIHRFFRLIRYLNLSRH